MKLISKSRRLVVAAAVSVAAVVIVPFALAWRARAELLEAAGAVCLGYFVAAYLDRGAWLVAAVALILKALSTDTARPAARQGRGLTSSVGEPR